jgi:hypothetical protein
LADAPPARVTNDDIERRVWTTKMVKQGEV